MTGKKGAILAGLVLGAMILSAVGSAGERKEKDYQAEWCSRMGGEQEHILPDRTRVDCLTATHAVEVEYAHKWAEAIGQSLYYGLMTRRSPGIVLITGAGDNAYVARLKHVAQRHHIKVWTIERKEN